MGKSQGLHEAARLGYYAIVERILVQKSRRAGPLSTLLRGNGVNAPDSAGYTAMHHAALNGHKDIVALLMSHDARLDVSDSQGATPLHLAAWAGHSDVVHVLLANGPLSASVDCKTLSGDTPLHSACHHGHVAVARLLLQHSCDPALINSSDLTPLMVAARHGRLVVLQLLLNMHGWLAAEYVVCEAAGSAAAGGVGGGVRRISGETPLHLAARYGHTQVVQFLVDGGFDVNICNSSGTALFGAAVLGKIDVVKYLLEAGVDTELPDERGYTVLQTLQNLHSPVSVQIRQLITDACKTRPHNTHCTSESTDFPCHSASSASNTASPTYQNVHLSVPQLEGSPVVAAIVSDALDEASHTSSTTRQSVRRRFTASTLHRSITLRSSAKPSAPAATSAPASSDQPDAGRATGHEAKHRSSTRWRSKRRRDMQSSARSYSFSHLLGNDTSLTVAGDSVSLTASDTPITGSAAPMTASATSNTLGGDSDTSASKIDDHLSCGSSPIGVARVAVGSRRPNIVCGTRALTLNACSLGAGASREGFEGVSQQLFQADNMSDVVRFDGEYDGGRSFNSNNSVATASLSRLSSIPPRKPPRRVPHSNTTCIRSSSSGWCEGQTCDGTYELLSSASSASCCDRLLAGGSVVDSGNTAAVLSPFILQSGAMSHATADSIAPQLVSIDVTSSVLAPSIAQSQTLSHTLTDSVTTQSQLVSIGEASSVSTQRSLHDDAVDDDDDVSSDEETVRSVYDAYKLSQQCPAPAASTSNPVESQSLYANVADITQAGSDSINGAIYSNLTPASSVYENFTPGRLSSCSQRLTNSTTTTTTTTTVLRSPKTPLAAPRIMQTSDLNADVNKSSDLDHSCAKRVSSASEMCSPPPPPDVAAIHISEVLLRTSLSIPPYQGMKRAASGADSNGRDKQCDGEEVPREVDSEGSVEGLAEGSVGGGGAGDGVTREKTYDSGDSGCDRFVTGSLRGLYRGSVISPTCFGIDSCSTSTLPKSPLQSSTKHGSARDDNNNNNNNNSAHAENRSSDSSFVSALGDLIPSSGVPDAASDWTPVGPHDGASVVTHDWAHEKTSDRAHAAPLDVASEASPGGVPTAPPDSAPVTIRQRRSSLTFSDRLSSFCAGDTNVACNERSSRPLAKSRASELGFLSDLDLHALKLPLIAAGYENPRFLRQLLDSQQLQLLGLESADEREQLLCYMHEKLPDGVADVCQQMMIRSRGGGRRCGNVSDIVSDSINSNVRASVSNNNHLSKPCDGEELPPQVEGADVPPLEKESFNVLPTEAESAGIIQTNSATCDVAVSEWLHLLQLQCHYGIVFMRLGVQWVSQLLNEWGDEQGATEWLRGRAGVKRCGHLRRMLATLRPLLPRSYSDGAISQISQEEASVDHVIKPLVQDPGHVITASQSEATIVCADSTSTSLQCDESAAPDDNIHKEAERFRPDQLFTDSDGDCTVLLESDRVCNDAKDLFSAFANSNNNSGDHRADTNSNNNDSDDHRADANSNNNDIDDNRADTNSKNNSDDHRADTNSNNNDIDDHRDDTNSNNNDIDDNRADTNSNNNDIVDQRDDISSNNNGDEHIDDTNSNNKSDDHRENNNSNNNSNGFRADINSNNNENEMLEGGDGVNISNIGVNNGDICRGNQSHAWLHRNSQLMNSVVNYEVNYVGSVRMKRTLVAEATRAAMQKLRRRCHGVKGTQGAREIQEVNADGTSGVGGTDGESLRVLLEISHTGVSFFKTQSKELICEHSINNIQCVCQDDESLSYFAYVIMDKSSRAYYCHVFCADHMDVALEVMITLGQAFELAYQLSLDGQ